MKTIIAKTFNSEKEMLDWLADKNNINDLKSKYPPPKYKGEMK